jgi:hypothetical protein
MALLGADLWTSADMSGIENREQEQAFVTSIDWDRVLRKASALQNGQPCKLSEKYFMGTYNIIRRITFENGTQWVVRLPMDPTLGSGKGMQADPASIMQSEVAAMNLVRYVLLIVPWGSTCLMLQ